MTLSARHHLIVRADVLKPPIREAIIIDWLCRLINGIGMKLADVPENPLVYYCEVPGNRGLTATALIETSNITLHTWDERSPAELQLDVFTCGELDESRVIELVGEFRVVRIEWMSLDRRDGIRIV